MPRSDVTKRGDILWQIKYKLLLMTKIVFFSLDPVFVGGHHVKYRDSRQDKVMVFFREKAEEFKPYDYGLADNPGTRYSVSRVATVCVVGKIQCVCMCMRFHLRIQST